MDDPLGGPSNNMERGETGNFGGMYGGNADYGRGGSIFGAQQPVLNKGYSQPPIPGAPMSYGGNTRSQYTGSEYDNSEFDTHSQLQ